ncbi:MULTISPECIES: GNAT family N-acetyltransferase [unclassified Acinetobacter]|uniref:GNAT family N-acetyltransferase n=1 Tax=unclassified Acinetobacter TaxID=196816 RepID=UPI0029343E62|nr:MULTISPECIES: GNAT family N-acetyltransferase [unclassified Acinetobacter]WOE30852.1 GNAT family N-acetyltransferase [Acinetobacter sp. SAAs470]WOE39047.1 GNAT family N-acetyltransferase [Acinetobacter sp. SAAs474]
MSTKYPIQHDDGIFWIAEDQHKLAEITYRWHNDKTIIADHTWVDDCLRGQGVAAQLLDALVTFARQHQLKIIAECSYVQVMFQRDQRLADVIASA